MRLGIASHTSMHVNIKQAAGFMVLLLCRLMKSHPLCIPRDSHPLWNQGRQKIKCILSGKTHRVMRLKTFLGEVKVST